MEFSVDELNFHIRDLLEAAPFFKSISVTGEISGFTQHSSGHRYFSLKDENSQISCVMFRTSGLAFKPQNGDKVKVKADLKVYVQRGQYQLLVNAMEHDGKGDLYRQFLELKSRLEAEGLFAQEYKKNLPLFPTTIGIVTSETGAVLQDILTTIQRRFPIIKLVLCPALVQGNEAPESLIRALRKLSTYPNLDLAIIARGGGSMEDLWCFNDEALVRALFDFPHPIVSAVGHETDFTLCDFVCDLRAPTPTAAAEICVPDKEEILRNLHSASSQNANRIESRLNAAFQFIDEQQNHQEISLKNRMTLLRNQLLENQNFQEFNLKTRFSKIKMQLSHAEELVEQSKVENILAKGYSITLLDGKPLRSSKDVKPGIEIVTRLKDGEILSTTK